MSQLEGLVSRFKAISETPGTQLARYIGAGKKVIGCFPYYVPEELVYAAGMLPFGIWGAPGTPDRAREYFASFYCTIAQMGLELALSGALNGLSGVIMPSMCDTLRPLTQNFRAARPDIPLMFLAHPQNRRLACGVQYTLSRYTQLKNSLESISGVTVTDGGLRETIRLYNASRAARREFVRLAGRHPEKLCVRARCAVLKSAYFMDKAEHTAMLRELNAELEALPVCDWIGPRVVVSGIINDNPGLLDLFDKYRYAITADDVAHESRSFRTDASEDMEAMTALAMQFAACGDDPLLYDPELTGRPAHVVRLVRESGARGAVVLMMQFCDPEELEYPSLKRALDEAGIPSAVIGADQQMTGLGQAETILQTMAERLR